MITKYKKPCACAMSPNMWDVLVPDGSILGGGFICLRAVGARWAAKWRTPVQESALFTDTFGGAIWRGVRPPGVTK